MLPFPPLHHLTLGKRGPRHVRRYVTSTRTRQFVYFRYFRQCFLDVTDLAKAAGESVVRFQNWAWNTPKTAIFQAPELFFLNLSDTGLPLNVPSVFHSFSEELFPYVLGPSFRSYTWFCWPHRPNFLAVKCLSTRCTQTKKRQKQSSDILIPAIF